MGPVAEAEEVTAQLQFPEPLPELFILIVNQLTDDVVAVVDIDLTVISV
jgi:hypothetical protein